MKIHVRESHEYGDCDYPIETFNEVNLHDENVYSPASFSFFIVFFVTVNLTIKFIVTNKIPQIRIIIMCSLTSHIQLSTLSHSSHLDVPDS